MVKSEITRYNNTAQDLINLNANAYCDLGPGRGEIAIKLKSAGKNVMGLEAPWEFEQRTSWSKEHGINIYKGEFFNTDFTKAIPEKVDCFSLIHCIAHFRFAPQELFEQVYNKLEKGGYFYLSTVNGGSLDRVLRLFRNGALTEEVKKNVKMDDLYYKYYNQTGKHLIWDSWMHVKEYRDFELKKMFEAEHFKVIDLKHRNNFQHWKTNLACKFWPHLAEEIIIIGQKL
jgi:SAM-dependent methyltransferase